MNLVDGQVGFVIYIYIFYTVYSGWWQLKYFCNFNPDPFGENHSHFDEHIFQMGWFNHHPVISG